MWRSTRQDRRTSPTHLCTMEPTTSLMVLLGEKERWPQSWPTTNSAQNISPCAAQYSGHTYLRHTPHSATHTILNRRLLSFSRARRGRRADP